MTTPDLSAKQIAEAYQLLDIEQWAVNVAKVSLPKTGRMDLRQHPFLRDILRDTHEELVFMKGAQMGLSTAALIRAFWFLTTFPVSVIYTMPTPGDVQQYTASRINPIITRSSYLANRIVNVNSVMLKQFAVAPGMTGSFKRRLDLPRSTIYFRGANLEPVAVDADMLIHDEEDLSNPQAIEQYESRLDASRFKWRFRLSTPRLPGGGIDRVFKRTDRRRWLIRCTGCNAEFEMAMHDGPWDYTNVVPETYAQVLAGERARYVCHRCGKEISDEQRLNGRWVAERTDPALPHGYAISQLAAAWVPAERVLERRARATWEADFWNLVVGIPWQSDQYGFSREALIGDGAPGAGLTDPAREPILLGGREDVLFMGVDPGMIHDWQVHRATPDGSFQIVAFGTASSWEELAVVYTRFRPLVCVVDGQFDPTKASEFAARWNVPGRVFVWLAFATIRDGSGRNLFQFDETNARVAYAPHTCQTATADELAATPGALPTYRPTPAYERFLQHMVNSQKVPVWVKGLESDRVIDHYEWHEVGEDHQFSAMIYAWLARHYGGTTGVPLVGLRSFTRGTETAPAPFVPGIAGRPNRRRR